MIGTNVLGYRILEPLDESGTSNGAYIAEDTELRRSVILKVLDPALADDPLRLEVLRRETESVAALSHPDILPVISIETADTIHFATIEWIPGRLLSRRLASGPLDIALFFRLSTRLADALSAAHHKGILHGSLTTRSILLAEDGGVKIVDFGLDPGMTRTGSGLQGADRETYRYMSPERIQGAAVDQRSDIFSLGAVLYEASTGRPAFGGSTTAAVVSAVLRDRPDPVTRVQRDLPAGLDTVLGRCLEKDPARRYGSVRDLSRALEAEGTAIPSWRARTRRRPIDGLKALRRWWWRVSGAI